ncbi:MAG: DUF4965 domain-containing protein [Planctomycetales bacterium]|nr:DUF4965 domain-containing protein [Planctomycetales bacterium]
MSSIRIAGGLSSLALAVISIAGGVTGSVALGAGEGDATAWLTPPSTPLVACDPYFSVWSPGAELAKADTTHWTGKPHRLTSLAKIDGKTYRLMGTEPAATPALRQTSLRVLPTRTIYTFADAGVDLTLTFVTPALPGDIDVLSRPVTYLLYTAKATDGKKHEVEVYFEANGELAVNDPQDRISGDAVDIEGLTSLKIGSVNQTVLGRRGDDLRIDWGYLYLTAAKATASSAGLDQPATLRDAFIAGKPLAIAENNDDVVARERAAAIVASLGAVGSEGTAAHLTIAYDDLYSIRFMGSDLRPYWRRNGWEASDLLQASEDQFEELLKKCRDFDDELMADLRKAGGENYAQLAALAYRQCFAAGKFVADANGQPLQFCKENHSNGCIGTSDVFYPMAPQFLLFGPSLAKSFIAPFMEYAASDRWRFPFAPHDLGTYPHATGQVYGGGERTEENQMPVEESGNLLILMAAIAEMEGNADFAGEYWEQLTAWAEYLKNKGFDPENQLCTDDFSGHLAHNVNLSVKAICGLGSFAKLCAMRGDQATADEYQQLARKFAQRWQEEALDGDHYRLAFDKPGTWSQKYNLVWDRILGLNLFPSSVAETEMAYYRKTQGKYGLPLDNRSTYTKLDWILWTATLTQNREDFAELVDPVVRFLNETDDRAPMTDWYHTHNAKKRGFTARPVVGGVFCQMLYDKDAWQKWAQRDVTKAGDYAPLPKLPVVTQVVPAADSKPSVWRYVAEKPADGWYSADFDDSKWQEGKSGFGTRDTPNTEVGTRWNSSDIWIRRTFDLPQADIKDLKLYLHHDEDAEVYINGVLAGRFGGYSTSYETLALSPKVIDNLRPTGNVLAVHCHQTGGGQYIDVGLATVQPAE